MIGAGVLGSEIAATARTLGCDVTVVDQLATSMQRQLGWELGERVKRLHVGKGVRVLTSSGVRRLVAERGRVMGADIGTEVLPADDVVVAIESAPRVGWLHGVAGLEVTDGVECDSRCRAADGIYAVGDVARWFHDGLGTSIRLENRTNATQQGLAVAANIMGADAPYVPVPYFWTDQYDVKVQILGTCSPDDEIEFVTSEPEAGRFVALAHDDAGVSAVVSWNNPKGLQRVRSRVAQRFALPAAVTQR